MIDVIQFRAWNIEYCGRYILRPDEACVVMRGSRDWTRGSHSPDQHTTCRANRTEPDWQGCCALGLGCTNDGGYTSTYCTNIAKPHFYYSASQIIEKCLWTLFDPGFLITQLQSWIKQYRKLILNKCPLLFCDRACRGHFPESCSSERLHYLLFRYETHLYKKVSSSVQGLSISCYSIDVSPSPKNSSLGIKPWSLNHLNPIMVDWSPSGLFASVFSIVCYCGESSRWK